MTSSNLRGFGEEEDRTVTPDKGNRKNGGQQADRQELQRNSGRGREAIEVSRKSMESSECLEDKKPDRRMLLDHSKEKNRIAKRIRNMDFPRRQYTQEQVEALKEEAMREDEKRR